METHDKILLAGELLVDAAKTYRAGETNIDFAKSILLAGAVIGIVAPWLEELGGKPSQTQLAGMAANLKGVPLTNLPLNEQQKEIGKSIAFYRLTYNSLKHAGRGEKTKPSDDRFFEANLKEEAYYLIGNAIDDYNKLPLSRQTINTKLSDDLLTLLQSHWAAL
ncbi:hypothetical protein SAMN05660284_01072 [Formivibrio citricus]|uniref:Uncharacterized protein n=1 Tax=Formivibrio citricus TaxID=83765 RepID=A0A1I4XRE2_9NEIS|nr:hypothetical protein [Formivibrio citricus]SFN28404.1 hypothetical protein SAMN05660284_01072 [Formivibrio citricus]